MLKSSNPTVVANLTAVLASDTTYAWAVKLWPADVLIRNKRNASLSASASFSTGLLSAKDWRARWIRGGGQCRKDFTVQVPVHRATVFVAACQYYTLFLDGTQVGDHVLDGPWTNFYTNRSCKFVTFPKLQNTRRLSLIYSQTIF